MKGIEKDDSTNNGLGCCSTEDHANAQCRSRVWVRYGNRCWVLNINAVLACKLRRLTQVYYSVPVAWFEGWPVVDIEWDSYKTTTALLMAIRDHEVNGPRPKYRLSKCFHAAPDSCVTWCTVTEWWGLTPLHATVVSYRRIGGDDSDLGVKYTIDRRYRTL